MTAIEQYSATRFKIQKGFYTIEELALWMGASQVFVHNALLNGEIASIQNKDGVRLIPFNFVELMLKER